MIEPKISVQEIETVKSSVPKNPLAALDAINANPNPIIAPTIPPISPRSPDSIRKIERMSEFLAPTAFIIPISLVLSTTEVNIVLAMPMLPIISDKAAIPETVRLIMFRTVSTD